MSETNNYYYNMGLRTKKDTEEQIRQLELKIQRIKEALEELQMHKFASELSNVDKEELPRYIYENASIELKKMICRLDIRPFTLTNICNCLLEGKTDVNKEIERLRYELRQLELEEKEMEWKRREEEKEKVEMRNMIMELTNEVRTLRSKQGLGVRNVRCYKCNKIGHVALNCKSGINKSSEYSSFSDPLEVVELKATQIEEKMKMKEEWIEKNKKIFEIGELIKTCELEECKMIMHTNKIIAWKAKRIPVELQGRAKEKIEYLLKIGAIEESNSMYRIPIDVLEKPDGTIRIVQNFIPLNKCCELDVYEPNRMEEIITKLCGFKWFTVLDLKDGSYNIRLRKEDRGKTAFEFLGKIYQWNVMPQGYMNATAVMQRTMNKIFGDMYGKGVETYIDDIVIAGRTKEEHDNNLNEVVKRLEKFNLRCSAKKVQYRSRQIVLLGFVIDGINIMAEKEKIRKVEEYAMPRTATELRRFLGLAGIFREFIKGYASKTAVLTDLLKGKINKLCWNSVAEDAFENLKKEFKSIQNIKILDRQKKIVLRTDASRTGIGAVLLQEDKEGKLRPVRWLSKKLTQTESKYSVSEIEMLAIKWAVLKLEYELSGKKFIIETDHKCLVRVMDAQEFNNKRIARMRNAIQHLCFEIKYVKGEENNAADALSRQHEEEFKKDVVIVEDEKKMEVIKRVHEETGHGCKEVTKYELNKLYDIKGWNDLISECIGDCRVCRENNRKIKTGFRFVETKEINEIWGIDIMHYKKESYLVGIDYFSRIGMCGRLVERSSDKIMSVWSCE